ncbi:MAG: hypothetical protein U0V73_15565 [Acidimicrobiia bacterium]
MEHTEACEDCVVSFIVNREPGDAVVIDAAEQRALRLLVDVGLVPRLRHRGRPVLAGERSGNRAAGQPKR